ncbi:MAG: TA system VapC family ribonuclease toxin [Burkholderiales bacterium]
MRALLDVNVLIALFDAEHIHHRAASQWFAEHGREGWATCPLTQNGCIRILSQAAYLNRTSARLIVEILADAIETPDHEFWPDSLSFLTPGLLDWRKVLTGRHLTDLYLLALATSHEGSFVTLDRGVATDAVPNVISRHLVILSTNERNP